MTRAGLCSWKFINIKLKTVLTLKISIFVNSSMGHLKWLYKYIYMFMWIHAKVSDRRQVPARFMRGACRSKVGCRCELQTRLACGFLGCSLSSRFLATKVAITLKVEFVEALVNETYCHGQQHWPCTLSTAFHMWQPGLGCSYSNNSTAQGFFIKGYSRIPIFS